MKKGAETPSLSRALLSCSISRILTTDRELGASRPVFSAVRIYAETNKIALYASAVKVLLLVVCALKA